MENELPKRAHPKHGIIESNEMPTIIFLTVCTKHRSPWLANDDVHEQLRSVWKSAAAWLVGRYILMPDHLHLFCCPGTLPLKLEKWVQYWKSQYSKRDHDQRHEWLTDHWDTRMRSWEHYAEKWEYVRFNAVRYDLVAKPEDWPFQGELNQLY